MKKECSEISHKEIRVFKALSCKEWRSNQDISELSGLSRRFANAVMLKFLQLGIVDIAEVFPRHLYRLSPLASKRNFAYMQRLKFTVEVFSKCRKEQTK